MMPEQVPPCPLCHSTKFNAGGGSISGSSIQQQFTCSRCGAAVVYTGQKAGAIITFFPPESIVGERFPEDWTEWMNKVLLPTWRDWEDRWDTHRSMEWRAWLSAVFYPAFPNLKGFVPEEYAKNGATSPFTDTTISYPECPPEAQALVDRVFNLSKSPPKIGAYIPPPEDLLRPVYPPKVPAKYPTLYLGQSHEWYRVDPAFSASRPVPEDPIIRHNREFFDEVWAKVSAELSVPLPARQEARNEYGGLEPWYTFTLDGVTFTVGWRKRVVSIQADAPWPLVTADIKALADRDKVTYEAWNTLDVMMEKLKKKLNGTKVAEEGDAELEGGWQSNLPKATRILIHAWGKEKTIEYLTTLCRIAKQSAPCLIDYADVERWILAAEGRDIHEELARTMFQKDKKELTPSEAKLHRAASFGILYGRNYGPPKEEPR